MPARASQVEGTAVHERQTHVGRLNDAHARSEDAGTQEKFPNGRRDQENGQNIEKPRQPGCFRGRAH